MIRIELVYGRRSFLGNLFDGISTVWLSVFLAVIAVLVALYFIPFADLFAGAEQLAVDEAVQRQSEMEVLSPVVSGQENQAEPLAEDVAVLPSVETTAALEPEAAAQRAREESPSRDLREPQPREPRVESQPLDNLGESALVLPPVGDPGVSVVVADRAAPVASTGAVASYTTACRAAVQVKNRVAADVELGLLSCGGGGEYELSGTVANSRALTQLEQSLRGLLLDVSSSSSREMGGRLYFFLSGRFADVEGGELATLSPEQARRLFAKVEHWADQCGIDGIAFSKTTSTSLSAEQTRQRRRLVGTGSHAQIGAFLDKLRSVEETAALAELILNPVQAGGNSSAATRLSAAIDIVVGGQ